MPRDFYPRAESAILAFTSNFSARISAEPQTFGTTPERASAYAALQAAFSQAYSFAKNPGSDSTTAFAEKDAARVALEKETRLLVKCVKSQWVMTDAMRIDLGLKPRPVRRRHVAPPDAGPVMQVVETIGCTLVVRLRDAAVLRRGKPRDVYGAIVFAYVGDQPPESAEGWKLAANTSRAEARVSFNSTLPPGTKVWLTACWTNARGQQSPMRAPIYAYLTYGVGLEPQLMRQAA